MDSWDVGLLVVAAYVAVMTLVRLMRSHRDEVAAQLRRRITAERNRRRAEQQQNKTQDRQRAA